ncbi:MAG: hypothetical protein R2831_12525 [Chitinophagaceae bacterium]
MPNFTQEQLLLFIFGEADSALSKEITHALSIDFALQQEILDIKKALHLVMESEVSPDEKLVQSVLRQLHEEQSLPLVL